MNKNLICYFSATGNTKKAALKIKEVIGGDLFSIEPVNAYTSDDLDWTNTNSRSSVEMQDAASRPEIKDKINNIDEYENIYIGFPIWWYIAPRIINTFVETNNLVNKNIYIFATSGSSSVDGSLNDLKNKYSNLKFVNSIRITNTTSNEEIINFSK